MHQQPCQWWKLATVVTLLVVAKSVLGDPKNNGLGARKTAMETRWAPTIFASTAMPEVLGQVGLNPQCLDIVPPHALNGIRQGLFYPKPPKTGSASEKGSLSSFAKVAGLVAAPPARGFNPDWNDANTGMRSVQQWCERQKHPAVSITRHNPIGAWIDSCMEYPLTVTTMRNPVDHRLSYVNYFLHLLKHENTLSSPANTLPDTLRSDPAFQFQPKDVPDLIFNATSFQYQAFNFLATWQFGFYGDIEPLWTVPRWQHWMQSLVLCELTQGQVKDPTVWEAIGMPSIHQFLQTVTFSKTMWEPSLLQLLSNVTAAVHRASLEFSQVPITASTLSNSVAAVFHRLYDVIIVTEKLDEGNIIFRHTVKPLGSNKLFHPCALIPKEINVHRLGTDSDGSESTGRRVLRRDTVKNIAAEGSPGDDTASNGTVRGKMDSKNHERASHRNHLSTSEFLQSSSLFGIGNILVSKHLDHLLWATARTRHELLMQKLREEIGDEAVNAELRFLKEVKGRKFEQCEQILKQFPAIVQ